MSITADMKFSDAFDLYLSVCSNREELTRSLAEFLLPHKGKSILDCSVGTGFATLNLIKDGFDIVCADGSDQMLEKFKANAHQLDVDARPLRMDWAELGATFSGVFDVVICRGNSLVYADMWDTERAENTRHAIERALRSMCRCLKPGGTLYVDIPSDASLDRLEPLIIHHPPREVEGVAVSVNEAIYLSPETRTRKWEVTMSIAGQPFEFTRYSHILRENELVESLLSIGFDSVERLENGGHRTHYQVFCAKKTAQPGPRERLEDRMTPSDVNCVG